MIDFSSSTFCNAGVLEFTAGSAELCRDREPGIAAVAGGSFWSTQQLVKELCERDNCQSQNEFIEKAIRFYAGYVSGKEAAAYLPPALVTAMRGTVQDSENRIARLLFKLAVEVNMMMNVLAAGMEISEEDLRQLRARCVREVKQTNGNISLKDAVKYLSLIHI